MGRKSGRKIDLKFKFNEYFMTPEGFSFRAERFYDDVETQRFAQDATLMVKWLEAAFIAGCRTMAQETLDTLGVYATSVAGIDELVYNRTQAFDAEPEEIVEAIINMIDALQDTFVPKEVV